MNIIYLIFAIFGGAFGAMIGGGPAFIICGLIGIAGMAAAAMGDTTILFTWALGPFLIPCVAYASGLCALQYATKRGYTDNGNDVGLPLMTLLKPDVILVGGMFGGVAFAIKTGLDMLGMASLTDTGGFTVVTLCIIARLLFFPKNWLGKVPDDVKAMKYGRFSVNATCGLPFCNTGFMKLIIGLVVSGSSVALSYIFAMSGNPTLAAIAVLPGFLFYTGMMVVGLPPYFGAALVAGYAYVFSGGSIPWGIMGGVITVYLTDILARLFNIYSDGNIDCIAAGLTAGTFISIWLFPSLGLYKLPISFQYIIIAVIIVGLITLSFMDEKDLLKPGHYAYKDEQFDN